MMLLGRDLRASRGPNYACNMTSPSHNEPGFMWQQLGFYVIAMIIGAAAGLSELLSRYSWSVSNVTKSSAGRAYLALNAFVALLAYLAAVEWAIPSGLEGKSEIWRVLLASLFGMAVLRSSFLNVRVGNEDLPTGFATIVNVFMKRAERSLDQEVVNDRFLKVEPLVEGLTYAATRNYLVTVTEGALRTLSVEEVDTMHKMVTKIDNATEVDDATKLRLLAMLIIDLTNVDLFALFAGRAKRALAAENRLASEREDQKRQILAGFKRQLRD